MRGLVTNRVDLFPAKKTRFLSWRIWCRFFHEKVFASIFDINCKKVNVRMNIMGFVEKSSKQRNKENFSSTPSGSLRSKIKNSKASLGENGIEGKTMQIKWLFSIIFLNLFYYLPDKNFLISLISRFGKL